MTSGFERPERRRIAEKAGDADQQVAEQGADLVGVRLQPVDVILELRHLQHLHAALDAAHERSCPCIR